MIQQQELIIKNSMHDIKQYFISLIEKKFKFLEEDYMFKIVAKTTHSCEFGRQDIRIFFTLDYVREFCVYTYIYIKNKDQSETEVQVDTLMRYFNYQYPLTFGHSNTQEEEIDLQITNLRNFLRTIAADFLKEPQKYVHNLTKLEKVECDNYTIENKMKHIRSRIEAAWNAKDFPKIVELLSPVQEWLNKSEVMKLEYAKKHMQNKPEL